MKGNVGEWSELYTMFRLLADGRLYAADAGMNKMQGICYEVRQVIRDEGDGRVAYCRQNKSIIIQKNGANEPSEMIPMQSFSEHAELILQRMRRQKQEKGAFEIPEVHEFMRAIHCKTIKAKSRDKADIMLMVHDIMSGREDTFGFSIKSQLGQPATLLNASGATNFTYQIVGHVLLPDEITVFDNLKKFKDKFSYLTSLGADIVFVTTDNPIWEFNLKMVTSEMPEIFAEMIKHYYKGRVCTFLGLLELLEREGAVRTLDDGIYLKHQGKELLTNIALGMVPGTLWTGDYEATGGYIIVKEDGELVCYHIYNRNAFRNYILANTRFDTPSRSKHGFGKIYEEAGEQRIKLNVQIRFVR